ncbi:unnamed protein product, partial [Brachionus calyciflorus]
MAPKKNSKKKRDETESDSLSETEVPKKSQKKTHKDEDDV